MTEKTVNAKDIVDLDMTHVTEEGRAKLREGVINQLRGLSEIGIITMLSTFKDDPDVFVVKVADDETMYAMSLGQLVTFSLGAIVTADVAREVLCSDMSPLDIALASLFSELVDREKNKND